MSSIKKTPKTDSSNLDALESSLSGVEKELGSVEDVLEQVKASKESQASLDVRKEIIQGKIKEIGADYTEAISQLKKQLDKISEETSNLEVQMKSLPFDESSARARFETLKSRANEYRRYVQVEKERLVQLALAEKRNKEKEEELEKEKEEHEKDMLEKAKELQAKEEMSRGPSSQGAEEYNSDSDTRN